MIHIEPKRNEKFSLRRKSLDIVNLPSVAEDKEDDEKRKVLSTRNKNKLEFFDKNEFNGNKSMNLSDVICLEMK